MTARRPTLREWLANDRSARFAAYSPGVVRCRLCGRTVSNTPQAHTNHERRHLLEHLADLDAERDVLGPLADRLVRALGLP